MSQHKDGPECPYCDLKLESAHEYMRAWFKEQVKPNDLTIHISDSFRNEAQQNDCVSRGTSKLHWPNSKHNKMRKDPNTGILEPCSEALDLFQIIDGEPIWDAMCFARVYNKSIDANRAIEWGGTWPMKKRDNPHFQIPGPDQG